MAIKKDNNNLAIILISSLAGLVVVAGIVITVFLILNKDNKASNDKKITNTIKTEQGKYKAVFLLNNQVYFGKIEKETDKTLVLNNVYYLQVNQVEKDSEDKKATNEPQISLVKLGEEMHGPENRLEIMNQNILFIEDLRKDSKVLEAIGNYEKQGTQNTQN